MYFSSIIPTSVADGNGVRVSLFVSGCVHHCHGCHNAQTWNFNNGNIFDDDTYKQICLLLDKPYIDGLTLTGGDPLCSYNDVLKLVKKVKTDLPTKTIWLYTGYTMIEIKENFSEILDFIDVIVDGRYVEEMRDVTLAFRGSSNQTIWEKDENGKWFMSLLNNRGK